MAEQHFDATRQTQEPKRLLVHSTLTGTGQDAQQRSTQSDRQIQYYFRLIISSMIDGAHILQLINFDVLNETLGLGIDLSEALSS